MRAHSDDQEASHPLSDMFLHQLRTPLTAVTGYLSLLLEGVFGIMSSEQREIIGIISRNVWRINLLLDDYRDLEQIEKGSVPVRRRLIPLSEILEPIVNELGSAARDKGIELSLAVEGDPKVFVAVDPVKRALLHLIQNAVFYTREGTVTVEAVANGTHSIVKIIDTGIGIRDDEKENLFKKYFRSSHPYVRENPGAGRGLYIAKSHIDDHGGSLRIDSHAERGTTLTMKLPALPSLDAHPE